jgi:cysteinyl-tRNA synthetase
MDLKLYDTLTREKRLFTPIDPARVRMYVCGPTVYDFAHIGNARPVIVFDVLFRLLRHLYGADHVTYVRNITDVDDKINARAAEEYPGLPLNEAIHQVTGKTEKQFHEDIRALGVLMPKDVNRPGRPPAFIEPRATEHIAEMRELIDRLVASGHAYVAEEHVLFSVSSMPDYGRLSKRSLDEMIAGARVEVAPYKREPTDFVLWKPSKPGEPAWPSPAGIVTPGRPGWHIECSAMSWKYLGETFDIHGGGIDLVFPHHENEIAQSRCAFHSPVMANYWMHNGFLQVEGAKMSKSEGTFITIHQLLADWPGEVLRFQMLMTHYRQPIDWTASKSQEAEDELWAWTSILIGTDAEQDGYSRAVRKEPPRPSAAVIGALLDDLNTPEAIAALRANYKVARTGDFNEKRQFLMDCQFLGLLRHDRLWVHQQGVLGRNTRGLPMRHDEARKLRISVANDLPELRRETLRELASFGLGAEIAADGNVTLVPVSQEAKDLANRIEDLVSKRNAARKARDFKEADRIRDELKAMNIELDDKQDGTTIWKMKR